MLTELSPDFFADLDAVCPEPEDEISTAFIQDLERAHAHAQSTLPQAQTITVAELNELAATLLKWRCHCEKLSSPFIQDLKRAYGYAQASLPPVPTIAVVDLDDLATTLLEWRSHHARLLENYLKRLDADDPLLSPVSLFGTMDYGRLETAHTRALAWLLGDKEHGFGFRLLEALLAHLRDDKPTCLTEVEKVESEYPLLLGPWMNDADRIDIFAEGRWKEANDDVSWVLAMEAKIDAGEGKEQLSRYDEWLDQQYPDETEVIRVFLAPRGREYKTSSAQWRHLSFLDLAGVLRRVSGLKDKPGYHFLRYYLTGVLKDVCGVPVPITGNLEDPYAAVEYLRAELRLDFEENANGESR